MTDPQIRQIVSGAMDEMTRTVVARFGLSESFSHWYRDKEIARFSNPLLFDPIARVAREPFRKLGLRNRLIGAAQLALSRGIVPENLLVGIMAAFCYENSEDDDRHISCLREALTPEDFLEIIIGLRPSEALYDLLVERWESNLFCLNEIRNA
jgi:mannitol-1-phosphate/altronate dehydrogenase